MLGTPTSSCSKKRGTIATSASRVLFNELQEAIISASTPPPALPYPFEATPTCSASTPPPPWQRRWRFAFHPCHI